MKSKLVVLFVALSIASLTNDSNADIVSMTIDQAQSFVDVSIADSADDRSATSGTLTLDITSTTPPSGSGQITSMNVVLDDALAYSLVSGLVTVTTTAGDVEITLISAGPPGTISAGQFDQIGNTFGTSGDVDVDDPNNVVGGSQTVDLSTIPTAPSNFMDVTLSQIGNVLTLEMDYTFTQDLELDGNSTPLVANGTLVATGIVAIPEPGSALFAGVLFAGVALRRRR